MRNYRALIASLLVLCVAAGCELLEEIGLRLGEELEVVRLGTIRSARLIEPSGLAASRKHPGVYWTHNDSDSPPQLFAIDSLGTILKAVHVRGALNRDWEDLTTDPDGNLYIADTGDNEHRRDRVVVYRLPEPDPFAPDSEATVLDSIQVRYPNGAHYDCEAIFWKGGRLYFLIKTASFRDSTLCFSVDARSPGTRVEDLRFEGARPDLNLVTAAEYNNWPRRRLAVLGYTQLVILGPEVEPFAAARKQLQAGIALGQCEGICWSGGNLIVINEAGEIYRVSGLGL
ncbi:MAG: hypothetical protein ONB23_00425 [candidate division KSB1 bacterium]|nr:hypothetical protein [candidate division KSB1 bacterium]